MQFSAILPSNFCCEEQNSLVIEHLAEICSVIHLFKCEVWLNLKQSFDVFSIVLWNLGVQAGIFCVRITEGKVGLALALELRLSSN